jgi:dTDP-4-dehydrorhamnose reductase
MRILSFGTTGQLAMELARHRPDWADLTALGRDRADLTDPAACADAIDAHHPDLVINAAAYTAVDQAESDAATARIVNAESPGAMARAASAARAPFLHVSTDYVFDGSATRPWREDDPTRPLGAYGKTKLEGEQAIAAAGGDFVILRTAWVFSAHGRNFVKTMLRLGAERETLSIVADQRGGPTPAADIAKALWTIAGAFRADRGKSGIFHYCGSPTVSWADFAEAIFAAAQLSRKPAITRIPTADFPTPATRPANSALDCSRILAAYGIAQPDWRVGLRDVMAELETK